MIEIPESTTLSRQGVSLLEGKTVKQVVNATSPHKFAWFNGDPAGYDKLLAGHIVENVIGHGAFVTIEFDGDVRLTVGDGTNMRYYPAAEQHPAKFQLMLVFDDYSCLVFTVAMYGTIYAFKGEFDNPYYLGSLSKTTPLGSDFDEAYFDGMLRGLKKDMSAKAFLATQQRIPGLGNGVLQDILFNARVNPKRKVSTLGDNGVKELFDSVKTTLTDMTVGGGRDTEKDLYGEWGGYRCVLSKNTYKEPCPVCGNEIIKEAYMGGAVYYCPICQSIKKQAGAESKKVKQA